MVYAANAKRNTINLRFPVVVGGILPDTHHAELGGDAIDTIHAVLEGDPPMDTHFAELLGSLQINLSLGQKYRSSVAPTAQAESATADPVALFSYTIDPPTTEKNVLVVNYQASHNPVSSAHPLIISVSLIRNINTIATTMDIATVSGSTNQPISVRGAFFDAPTDVHTARFYVRPASSNLPFQYYTGITRNVMAYSVDYTDTTGAILTGDPPVDTHAPRLSGGITRNDSHDVVFSGSSSTNDTHTASATGFVKSDTPNGGRL